MKNRLVELWGRLVNTRTGDHRLQEVSGKGGKLIYLDMKRKELYLSI